MRAWPPFSPINISKKRGLLSERAFWKWGSLGESKMWKIKRGSFSDRRFENGGQCGRTYPSHIFRESPTPRHQWSHARSHDCACGSATVFTNWAGYAIDLLLHAAFSIFREPPDLEMYRVSRLLRRGRVGSKVRTKNMINTALEIERLRRWTYFPHAIFLNIID